MMRTTINLPEDVFKAARSLAVSKGISYGDAIAELVRRGLRAPARIDRSKHFPCFPVSASAAPITLEQTLEAEDEL